MDTNSLRKERGAAKGISDTINTNQTGAKGFMDFVLEGAVSPAPVVEKISKDPAGKSRRTTAEENIMTTDF